MASYRESFRRALGGDWSTPPETVDPLIFASRIGALLRPSARAARGAYLTPRQLVTKVVEPTILEPLQQEWSEVWTTAEQLRKAGRPTERDEVLEAFHRRLLALRVLDPACGTGNFLFVAYDLVKRLERQVLEALGHPPWGSEARVSPEQFRGIDVDPWSCAIAELVLWFGALEWYPGEPGDPVAGVTSPRFGRGSSIGTHDALLTDGGEPARWPAADFIVGNPPYLGARKLRRSLGDGYVERLRRAFPDVPGSVNLCMYWWSLAGEEMGRPGRALRTGFLTTSAIALATNRQVIDELVTGPGALRSFHEVLDEPWPAAPGGASVRVAIHVLGRSRRERVARALPDSPVLSWSRRVVRPADDGRPRPPCYQGVKLVGDFAADGLDRRVMNPATGKPVVRELIGARALVGRRSTKLVIDFTGLTEDEVQRLHPAAFGRVTRRVEPVRREQRKRSMRERWWRFGWERQELRAALKPLSRYLVTPAVAKHRIFTFIPGTWLADGSLYAFATDDPWFLGVLSSRVHRVWALAAGGHLGRAGTPRWSSRRCYEAFPLPRASARDRALVRGLGEEIEEVRLQLLAAPGAFAGLTDLYNRVEDGRCGQLRELHDELDARVASLYGLHEDATDHEIVEGLLGR